MFSDSPEYLKRKKTPFAPPNVTYPELRKVIPAELYAKSTLKGFGYVAQDLISVSVLYYLCLFIDELAATVAMKLKLSPLSSSVFYWSLWASYWVAQSIAMAGCWCLGHEAGHGNISPSPFINDFVGFILHTSLLTPYFAWKRTHHTHHKMVASLENDENYVPSTCSELAATSKSRLHEMFEDTPLYTLGRLCVMQLLGFQLYMVYNVMGCPRDPPGTNHFSPSSVLFKPKDYYKIILSDFGLLVAAFILTVYGVDNGLSALARHYFVPYLLCHHWIVMITYLHHSDPTLPHYRAGEWSFLRGALATVDRPILGWIGRVYFHNVSHDHIGHHLFVSIPFYNQPAVTEKLKTVLGEEYNYDSTNSFYALYRSFSQCLAVSDEGEIVMYQNRLGKTARAIAC